MPSFHSSQKGTKKVRKSTYFLILFDDALQAALNSQAEHLHNVLQLLSNFRSANTTARE